MSTSAWGNQIWDNSIFVQTRIVYGVGDWPTNHGGFDSPHPAFQKNERRQNPGPLFPAAMNKLPPSVNYHNDADGRAGNVCIGIDCAQDGRRAGIGNRSRLTVHGYVQHGQQNEEQQQDTTKSRNISRVKARQRVNNMIGEYNN